MITSARLVRHVVPPGVHPMEVRAVGYFDGMDVQPGDLVLCEFESPEPVPVGLTGQMTKGPNSCMVVWVRLTSEGHLDAQQVEATSPLDG